MQINCAHKCQVCSQSVAHACSCACLCVCLNGKYRIYSNKLLSHTKVSSPRKIIASTQQNASQNFLAPPFATTLVRTCVRVCMLKAFVGRLCQ